MKKKGEKCQDIFLWKYFLPKWYSRGLSGICTYSLWKVKSSIFKETKAVGKSRGAWLHSLGSVAETVRAPVSCLHSEAEAPYLVWSLQGLNECC
jgi:hypothetical protein